jgi:hypothetical protein
VGQTPSSVPSTSTCAPPAERSDHATYFCGRGQGVHDVRVIDGRAMGHVAPACSRSTRTPRSKRRRPHEGDQVGCVDRAPAHLGGLDQLEDYDRAAAHKIILTEGREEHFPSAPQRPAAAASLAPDPVRPPGPVAVGGALPRASQCRLMDPLQARLARIGLQVAGTRPPDVLDAQPAPATAPTRTPVPRRDRRPCRRHAGRCRAPGRGTASTPRTALIFMMAAAETARISQRRRLTRPGRRKPRAS